MNDQNEISPNLAERGSSENIHQDIANNPYFNMIITNLECALFCCAVLEQFDDLLERFCPDNPRVYKANELDLFISLHVLQKQYGG